MTMTLFRKTIVSVLCVLALLAAAANAEQDTKGWQPPPPPPDEFDWIQLTSGEWLKGEIVALYRSSLEFDSDKLDLLNLDWDDVEEVRSAGTMQVAFEDRSVVIGKILIDQKTITIVRDGERRLDRSKIVAITAGEPKEINYWTAKASLGANLRRGNSEQIDATGRATLIRRTARNRIIADYQASFSRTGSVTTSDTQLVETGWSLYTSNRVFWKPLQGEWYRDRFSNIAARTKLSAGIGYQIIDTPKTTWEADGALGYQGTQFIDVSESDESSANTPAITFATKYETELTRWMDLNLDYRLSIVNEESGSYIHHLVTGCEFDLTKLMDLEITLIWDRITNPTPDSEGVVPKQDDVRLVFSLGFDL